jgi:SAM-dependent methyltransferase
VNKNNTARACWCGHPVLEPFSEHYNVCRNCGTLVSLAAYDSGIYNADYWLGRQTELHGLPDIRSRARLDLPERCTHWLRHLLTHKLPPATVLEIGCAHGGYVALMGWAGFDAIGTELDAAVARQAHELFGVKVLAGEVEKQPLVKESFDVVVLNDVLEHLPDPVSTMRHCAGLLSKDGFLVVQTPEYKEHLSFEDLKASDDLFLKHMEKKQEEHLFLYSRRSVEILFARLGLPHVAFSNPIFPYDMFLTASRSALPTHEDRDIANATSRHPTGRLVQALLDKSYESNDRWWAIQRLEDKVK